MEYLLFIVAAIHLIICPYTKIEENFNVQAMHDILYHGRNITQYHHHDSAEGVPQTFIGAMMISVIVSPVNYLIENCGLPGITKFTAQIIVRAGLGVCVIWSYALLKNAIEDRFGKQVAMWFIVIGCSQFHFMFYCTRPLSNMMVMPFVLLALRYWLLENHRRMIWLSAVSVVIFNVELLPFFLMIIVYEGVQQRISFKKILPTIFQAGLGCLFATVSIDSYLWQRLTWPAGEAFLSSQSSTIQPLLWYWYSAIPRSLGFSTLFVPVGVYFERRMIPLFSVCSIFILLNSFLPHKESRIIIYAFPLLNVVASCGCNILWNGRHKSFMRQCLGAAAAMHLGGNLIITVVLLSIAYSNYPGGEAIYRIHKIIPPDNNVVLYIDNVAIQSGVNRFTQINNNWKYYIADSTEWENTDLNKFTHLMIEAKSKYSKNLRPFFKSHDVMEFVEGFSHLHVNYQHYPPFKIKRKPILTILRRRDSPSSSGKQPTNIEETVEQQPEEGMREIEDEEERHDIQLETYPPDITPLDSTKTSEENTHSDPIPSKNVLKDSNNLNFNRSKEENATSNEFETKSLELQVNSMKYKQISRTTEPHRAANLTELAHDERMTADSTKSENDFLREPEMTFPLPTGSAQTTNSRIKKSAMKTIRSKTNNLAFDALQDALREEENRPQSEGTPGNQLVMLMPLVSGRRKFIMPNIDISETNDSEDFPKENTQEMREKFSSGLKPSETQLDGSTTESSTYPSGSTKGKSMNDPNYNNGINAYPSSSVNDMVQYNPKSIQLTVQERGETAVNTVVPNLGPSQTTVATITPNGRSMQQEQASYQVDNEHAIELYRVNHPEIQKESTLSPDRPTLKQNMDIGNRPVNRQSFVFLWFPEEAKLFKEYNRIEEMGSPPQVANSRNTNVLSNQVPQSTTTKEPPIVLNERQKHNSGRNINNIVRTSNKIPEVVIQPGKEQMNEKLESEQRKRTRM